jgi:hypothetical protein
LYQCAPLLLVLPLLPMPDEPVDVPVPLLAAPVSPVLLCVP